LEPPDISTQLLEELRVQEARVIPQGEDLALSWKLEKWKNFSMCWGGGGAERGGQNDTEDIQEEKKLGGGYKEEAGVGQ